jgi:hypothetical protein
MNFDNFYFETERPSIPSLMTELTLAGGSP